ncbi:hypothetical protein RYZ27_01595 [Hyphomonas sp. FCG-A18]|uniref:hypothetical protein n=1 Tax=Hyphomonas sp. FCG-A18 TaxID=3080019 RepID=UPI002B2D9799|nr:hypothetical protein RYZ27_01595 [Hyphomonas sp. FCG-A18]
MSSLQRFSALLEEQMTPRLAWGLVAVAALIAAFIYFEISDLRNEAEANYNRLLDEKTVVSETDGLDKWQDRAQQASTARGAWDKRVWSGPTPGIASAEAQAALNAILNESGLQSVNLQVSSDPIRIDNRDLLRFEVRAVGDSHAFIATLVALSTSDRAYMITEMSIPMRDGQVSRITFGGYLPFIPIISNEDGAS